VQAGKNAVQMAAAVLSPFNAKQRALFQSNTGPRPRINYYIEDVLVCRTFYCSALGLFSKKCDKVAAYVLGDETHGVKSAKLDGLKRVELDKNDEQYMLCVAFWQDFFKCLCQSPHDGLRLFPVYATRKAIYAMDFVMWFLKIKKIPSVGLPPNAKANGSTSNPKLPHVPDKSMFHDPAYSSSASDLSDSSCDSFSSFSDTDSSEFSSISTTSSDTDEEDGKSANKVLRKSDKSAKAVPRPVGSAKAVPRPVGTKPKSFKVFRNPKTGEVVSGNNKEVIGTYDVDSDGDVSDGAYYHVHPKAQQLGIPSFRTFNRARHHEWFKDVQPRPKHFHARCTVCKHLRDKCAQGWANNLVEVEEWENKLRMHQEEVTAWRTLEQSLQVESKHQQHKMICLSYDDTSALRLPRFTNREPKTLPHSRVDFVPFNITNHGIGENAYVYHVKHSFPKGANRLCTILYNMLRRIKDRKCDPESPEGRQRRARKLVLLADNFIENKCNDLFCFLSHIVSEGWFDEVEMFFGPVGHTHNGNDSQHYVHNQVAGDYNSVTLPEYTRTFVFAWEKPDARPQPVILDCEYDWSRYYKSHIQKVSNIHNNVKDHTYVRAAKIAMGTSGLVEIHFKGSPSSPIWTGAESPSAKYPEGKGWVVLHSVPRGAPEPLDMGLSLRSKKVKQMRSHKFKTAAKDVGCRGSMKWLLEVAATGRVPRGPELQEGDHITQKAAGWGPVFKCGVGDRTFEFPFLVERGEEPTYKFFWEQPQDLVTDFQRRHRVLQSARPQDCDMPQIRYTKDPKEQKKKKAVSCVSSDEEEEEKGKKKKSSKPKRRKAVTVVEKKKTNAKRKKKKGSETEDSDASSEAPPVQEEDSPDEDVEDAWNADPAGCVVGHFAVVHSLYVAKDKKMGLSLVKVTNVLLLIIDCVSRLLRCAKRPLRTRSICLQKVKQTKLVTSKMFPL
jgi:hypothetical protein